MFLPQLLWKHRHSIVLLLTLILSAILIAEGLGLEALEHQFSSFVATIIYPFQKSIAVTSRGIQKVLTLPQLIDVGSENDRLRLKIRSLEREIANLREERLENERLRELLGFAKQGEQTEMAAEVIGRDSSSWFSTIVVDKGWSDGVKSGMPAVVYGGVVGRVTDVYPYSSKLLLILDPNSKVAAMLQRTRAQGIVQGSGQQTCFMRYVERSLDVRPGDLVVTSGTGGIYPKGLVIGRIGEVERKTGELFQLAQVLPSANFSRLEEVLIMSPADLRGLSEAPAN